MSEQKILLNDDALSARLDAQTAPRVTKDHIKSRSKSVEYIHHGLLTFCILTMANGFKVIGHSACVSAANYDQEIGNRIAYDNALSKVWELEAYLLAEKEAGRNETA